IEDIDAVERWTPRLGLEVETVRVGEDVPNRAIAEVSAPQWVEAGEPLPIDLSVSGAAGDSVAVVVRRDGRVIGRAVAGPAATELLASRGAEVRLEPAARDDGWVRLDVALETGDAVSDDDTRTLYVQVGDEPAGVALVSFRPDWEPRFLAPLLERSLGLPLRAYLRGATGRWVRLASGLEAGAAATEEDVRRAVQRGQLVVLHGVGIDAPQWAHEALRSARHLLVFPAGQAADLELPVAVSDEITGDFFASPTIPSSPVAALL